MFLWNYFCSWLTHWSRATHICVGKLTIIGSDNGLSPGRHQAIIWTIAGILLIGPLVTNFSEILIGIQTFSFNKMHLKLSSGKWRPFCLGLNVLKANNSEIINSGANSSPATDLTWNTSACTSLFIEEGFSYNWNESCLHSGVAPWPTPRSRWPPITSWSRLYILKPCLPTT